jgi:ATP-binding cassette subfamily F protein uup
MPLITVQDVDFSIGGPLLFDHITFALEPNERVCVVGRNGAGKSTLLRLIAGEIRADDGEMRRTDGVRVAKLAQEVPDGTGGSVFDMVSAGLGETGSLLAQYHHLIHEDEIDTDALAAVQSRIEAVHGWDLDRRVTQILEKFSLNEDDEFNALSGGMKRRVLLAQAVAGDPDVLLLDEPTNHLDIEAIAWLEEFLRSFRGSVMFVTHDRRFLRALATRIVEIDRGELTSWPGDYANYLRRREERLHAQAQENARFDKMLAQEEVWIRQGIKARRVRDEGRVKRLETMRRERQQRRELTGNARMQMADAQSSGKRVIELREVSYGWRDKLIVRDFSTVIQRGDRVGLIGPNGSGKTTLLRLLLGDLAPQSGEVIIGTNLQIAYFDQHRATLREDWNALDNVSEGRDFIELNGQRKHVLGYLQDFLFTPERARAPITRLSGGERNRLLLAKLLSQPSNLLVLDEPTNDLDVETLELLEEMLGDYAGTILLVSHDRDFLDAVVTSTIVLEGDGRVGEYVGGYTEWLRQRPRGGAKSDSRADKTSDVGKPPAAEIPALPRRKLSYKDQRELELLPARIETLEKRTAELGKTLQDPQLYQKGGDVLAALNTELAAVQKELEVAYSRWETLESGA